MASVKMLSIPSSRTSCTLPKTRPLSTTLCRRKFFLKPDIDSSSFFITISVRKRKAEYVSLGPRRGGLLPIFMNLPTANPEWAADGKFPKWSERAIRSFCVAETVARKMNYKITGTEALLMGILMEGTSPAAKFLRVNGVTLSKVREETIKFLGVSELCDNPFQVEMPLSEHAQKALDSAVEEKIKLGETGEITTSHMLLGIWAQKGSTGQKILANLGFDDKKAEELKISIKELVISSL